MTDEPGSRLRFAPRAPHLRLAALLSAAALTLFGGPPALAASTSAPTVTSGTVVGWGYNEQGQATPPAGLSGVVAISAGQGHSLALKSDGTVVGWGWNAYGQASPPAGLSGVVAISAGGEHSLALKSDGTVVGWGANYRGQATPPAGLSGVVAISAGGVHSLALKSDGTVVGWGWNAYGQASPPAGLSGVVAIAAGGEHSLALKSDGTVVGWGWNAYGAATPPAGLSSVVAFAAGFNHSLALKSDGTVVGWGDNGLGEATPPAGLSGVVAIAAGYNHSLALKSDGTVVGWGWNVYGQATPPAGLHSVIAISAGREYGLALTQAAGPFTSVVPKAAGQWSGPTLVKMRSTGIQPGAVVTFSGDGITTTVPKVAYSTLLTVRVTVAAGATLGRRDVTITNPDHSTRTCTACFTVNPAPTVTSVTGGSVAPGASGVPLTVTGTNFKPTVTAGTWIAGVTIVAVTRTDREHLTVTIDVAPDAPARTGALTIINPDGGTTKDYHAITIT